MGLSEVLNIVIALCTVVLTVFAGIGLFTWKHQNRFEEKVKTLNEIFRVTCTTSGRLGDSLIYIPMIQIFIKKASKSNLELDDTSLLDAIDRFVYVLGEHDTLESSMEKHGLKWVEDLRIKVEEARKFINDFEFLTLKAKAIKLESINEIEDIFKSFVNFVYMFNEINCLMTLPKSEFQTTRGADLIQLFSGLDHKKINQELAGVGIKCRNSVRENLKILYR